MAQTHSDNQHAREFLDQLEQRAAESQENRSSEITTGKPGEEPLAVFNYDGVQCTHMPPDEQDILRISIGGGDDLPVPLNYCVFRGDRGKCIQLLTKALNALRYGKVE